MNFAYSNDSSVVRLSMIKCVLGWNKIVFATGYGIELDELQKISLIISPLHHRQLIQDNNNNKKDGFE